MQVSKYIGIPYVFAGHSMEGADCVGLVRMFYADHHWKPAWYDGEFKKDWYITQPYRMIRYLLKNLIKEPNIDNLRFGDIVFFMINDEGHLGIYLEYHKILTTFPPNVKLLDGSIMPDKSMIMRENIWLPAYRCGFKRKG